MFQHHLLNTSNREASSSCSSLAVVVFFHHHSQPPFPSPVQNHPSLPQTGKVHLKAFKRRFLKGDTPWCERSLLHSCSWTLLPSHFCPELGSRALLQLPAGPAGAQGWRNSSPGTRNSLRSTGQMGLCRVAPPCGFRSRDHKDPYVLSREIYGRVKACPSKRIRSCAFNLIWMLFHALR